MVMIVALHVVGHGNAQNETEIVSINFIFINLLKSLSIVAVNCFILISGFYGIFSNFKFKKLITLYKQILFYSISIYGVFWVINKQTITGNSIISAFLPIITNNWWFITIYLVLYLISPFLNRLLKILTFKEYNRLLIILSIVFVGVSSVIFISNPIDNTGGYSLYNFIYMYIVGAYIRRFFLKKKFNKKRCIFYYLLLSVLLCLINTIISIFLGRVWGVYSYNFIFVILASISLFLFFKELEIKSNIINTISTLTLGIYLIHDHPYIRENIYKFLNYSRYFNTNKFIFYTILMIIIIFTTAAILELFRQYIFKYISHTKMNFYVENKISKFLERYI